MDLQGACFLVRLDIRGKVEWIGRVRLCISLPRISGIWGQCGGACGRCVLSQLLSNLTTTHRSLTFLLLNLLLTHFDYTDSYRCYFWCQWGQSINCSSVTTMSLRLKVHSSGPVSTEMKMLYWNWSNADYPFTNSMPATRLEKSVLLSHHLSNEAANYFLFSILILQTSLCHICANGLRSIAELVIKTPGVDPNLADNDGNTPLIFAAQAGHCFILATKLYLQFRFFQIHKSKF